MADAVIITLGTLELPSKVSYQCTECHKQEHVLVSVRWVQIDGSSQVKAFLTEGTGCCQSLQTLHL